MMNCQQATRLLSDARERKLSLGDRAALRFHTMMCSGCHNFSVQMDTLSNIAHMYAKGMKNDASDVHLDPNKHD